MNELCVVAYFADDPSRTYQLVQWLPVLERLDHQQPVTIVARDPDSAAMIRARTMLPVVVAVTFPELTALYAERSPKVVLYCNNSPWNFQSLVEGRALHVHINHGESDKQSMASNNAKAYDRVFVAGEAAVQRQLAGLMELDPRKLVRIGRPQLDLRPPSVLPPSPRRTVLYAPTWEGDADYNDYTSVDTIGREIVRAVLGADVRLVYKPHPQVTVTRTPRVRQAHRDILRMVADAAAREPAVGHTAVTTADILAVMPDCDAMITDVSSVGLDWLYLRTECPIFMTDRHHDPERLRREVPVSRCADVITDVDVEELAALVVARLDHDEHHLSRVAMRHHYFDDIQIGESTTRFVDAVAELVELRDRYQGEAGQTDETDAITA